VLVLAPDEIVTGEPVALSVPDRDAFEPLLTLPKFKAVGTVISKRESRQVWNRSLERLRHRTLTSSIGSVASSAVILKDACPVHRTNWRLSLVLNLRDAGDDHGNQQNQSSIGPCRFTLASGEQVLGQNATR
jgi:hypothetical protein